MSYRIQEDNSGRKNVTLPASICDGFGWGKGTELTFEITGEKELKIEEVDE
ncbi:MAG: AbrB/MazE/SpoVT family DNA-binding domain-containing protein [Candidatus Nanohaloarchaea archaeon]